MTKLLSRLLRLRLAFAILAAFLSLSALAQHTEIPVMSRAAYSQGEVYTFVQPVASYVHPQGYPVTVVVVAASSTGTLYRVPMRDEAAKGMEQGAEVIVYPTELP